MPPVIRKPFGVIAIILGIAAYAGLVAVASGYIAKAPIVAQAAIYLVAGIAWVPAFMPMMRFIETGRFTKPRALAGSALKETKR